MNREVLIKELQTSKNSIHKVFIETDNDFIEDRLHEAEEELKNITLLLDFNKNLPDIENELIFTIVLVKSALNHMKEFEYRGTPQQVLELTQVVDKLTEIELGQ
ncbi:hypothetical protein COF68_04710 [Bacillus toyonensis]|uniref:hypothetical protein n=1 Tax=Bacillus toyonensis TaxID=155322 RepID=UPI000BFE75DA|nr:hypothetical protein [Bacillus toyonensis]PHE64153.1 hypothetical protein COF68_04710 [Bacillus toyonensis]